MRVGEKTLNVTEQSLVTPGSGAGRVPTGLRQLSGAAVVAVLALTACAPEGTAEFEDGESGATESAEEQSTPDTSEAEETDGDGDVLVAEIDDPVTFEECEEAEEREESSVTWLDDVVIEEVEIASAVASQTAEIGVEEIEIPGAPAIIVPERVGQAGCIIEYDAPGACLSAVEISGSYIPGYTIPGRTVPQVELPDGTVLQELVQEEVRVPAEEQEGTRQEEVCQDDPDEARTGGYISSVYRSAIYRSAIYQSASYVSAQYRSAVNLDEGSVDGLSADGYGVDGMGVDGVGVDGEGLDGYRLEGAEHTERSGEDAVFYTTEGDVLFDPDEYELRSDAESELQAIVEDIAERDDDYVIEVEGHTDDLPTSTYDDNYELSELRARSVADWLIDNADVDEDLITAEGLGEDYPRADNGTDDGRQLNRRVVVAVKPAEGGQSSIDYEVEEAEEDDG